MIVGCYASAFNVSWVERASKNEVIIIFNMINIYVDLLCVPQAERLNVVRVGVVADSDLFISVTCNHMTVARRQKLGI